MSQIRPSSDAPPLLGALMNCTVIRERLLLGLMIYTLIASGETLAGDQPSIAGSAAGAEAINLRQSSPFAASVLPMPGAFASPTVIDSKQFSPTDFRPRKRSVADFDQTESEVGAPMLKGTTVWQRMSEFKSHDRVRLLTLWESGGSSVSLQAGKRGDPSLQWTSRSINRGEATRGLLDRLFSVSLRGAGNTIRGVSRATNEQTASKQLSAAAVPGAR